MHGISSTRLCQVSSESERSPQYSPLCWSGSGRQLGRTGCTRGLTVLSSLVLTAPEVVRDILPGHNQQISPPTLSGGKPDRQHDPLTVRLVTTQWSLSTPHVHTQSSPWPRGHSDNKIQHFYIHKFSTNKPQL